ncbi:hypothetical protein ASD11_02615 [Aeromicrobium sp. Root495]|uniref:hypothetical protein n=1 Tax=Aeromicrobium sp. Root495 TaxID=1736550 RepID=UPI0006F8C2D1|nr:hypothetical protein [Aeromicrobium sp. Root495]KQY58572.1 hypothetical protein ASD11_02615 [Aeromicrobium sp. Root495]
MDHHVDLDELASRLARLVPEWRRLARVSAFTWRDEKAAWPQPITSDRDEVIVPESLGIRLLVDPADEAEIVVWTGGWADIGLLMDGEVLDLSPEFSDVDGAYAAIIETIEDFLA